MINNLKICKEKIFNKIIATALALLLAVPCCLAQPQDTTELVAKTHSQKKSEIKKVLKRFAKSMVLVAGSCVCIWGILLAYKRFGNKHDSDLNNKNLANDLNSPDTTDEAVKLVIEKF